MSTTHSGRWRRYAAIAAALVVGVGAGAAVTHGGTEPQSPGVPPATTLATGGADPGPGPREMVEGVGVGFSHDEAGAVAAAVSYTVAPQAWLYRSDEVVRASVEAITVPAARADLVSGLLEDARLLRDELSEASGVVWFVVAPLATKVESYRTERAVVRVWATRVLSADGVAVPQAGWHTETFELAWVGGDWRIAGVEETEGPTPQLEAGLQPWAADYLDQELAGFVRLGTS